MDIISLYQDYSVIYMTEGHRHCRPGWVNVECPWCISDPGHEGYHLGYSLESDGFVCWRCGWHSVIPTIAKLIQMTEKETYFLIKKYGARISKLNQDITVRLGSKIHRLPSGVSPLSEHHKRYLLEKRNFDPDQLEKDWKLLSTGPVSILDHLNYKHRILIPYIWDGKEVSFDTRDVTDKALSKYMACPKSREIVSHKEIIYGKQESWTDKLICVEGTTDVWRFGFNSGAVSGIKFTPKQVKELAKFKRVPVCFDGGESQAIHQANRLVSELKFRGVDSFRVDIEGDPGSMKQSDADYLVKQLIS